MLVLDVAYKCGITSLRYDVTLFRVLCLMLYLDEIWRETHLLKLQDNQNSCHLNLSIAQFSWIWLLKWSMQILKWRCKVVGSVIIL